MELDFCSFGLLFVRHVCFWNLYLQVIQKITLTVQSQQPLNSKTSTQKTKSLTIFVEPIKNIKNANKTETPGFFRLVHRDNSYLRTSSRKVQTLLAGYHRLRVRMGFGCFQVPWSPEKKGGKLVRKDGFFGEKKDSKNRDSDRWCFFLVKVYRNHNLEGNPINCGRFSC